MRKTLILLLWSLFAHVAFAQTTQEYKRKYDSGKQLLTDGKYQLAQEVLRPLLIENPENPFTAYAYYYSALASFKAAKLDESRLMLRQLLEKYPQWPDADNAHYLLGNIALEKNDWKTGFAELDKVKSKPAKDDVPNLKKYYIAKAKNLIPLKEIMQKSPDDKDLASMLVDRLMASADPNDVKLATQLNDKFKFNKSEEIQEQTQTEKKTSYNVAVLFPFQYSKLVADKAARNNQFAVDMYNGIKLGKAQLEEEGIKINLFAYEIDNSTDKMLSLVNQPGFANMDLLIGPLYGPPNKVASTFANQYKIGLVNPISNNAQLVQNSPASYLLQPSFESQAINSAKYALQTFTPKSVVIIYGYSSKDSLMAHNYRKAFIEGGGKVLAFKKILQAEASQIEQVMAGKNETNLGHVFITTPNQNVAANFISVVEKSFSKIPIITLSNWLEFQMLSFEQYERRNIHFIYPEYVDYLSDTLSTFKKKYISQRNIIPSLYSYQGFDLLVYFGRALAAYGTNFHAGLQSQPPARGLIIAGFDYRDSNDNQYVPLVKFQNSGLVLVNSIEPK
jgi:tetratricopeptide (TPR) repeat protein